MCVNLVCVNKAVPKLFFTLNTGDACMQYVLRENQRQMLFTSVVSKDATSYVLRRKVLKVSLESWITNVAADVYRNNRNKFCRGKPFCHFDPTFRFYLRQKTCALQGQF